MARTFNGTTDSIDAAIGGCNITMGGITLVAIGRRTGTGQHPLVVGYDPGANSEKWNLKIESSANGNHLTCGNGAADAFTTDANLLLTSADGWFCAAVTKASGTVVPRFHLHKYQANSWAHVNSPDALADGTAPGSSGIVNLGHSSRWNEWFGGDYAVGAVFNRVLSDSEIESLAYSLTAWYAAKPVGMWVLDQAAVTQKVNDHSGSGGDESARSGTSVATTSAPFTYTGDVWPTIAAPVSGGGSPQSVSITGLASESSFGGIATSVGGVTVSIAGLASQAAFGSVTPIPRVVTVPISGLNSEAAFGSIGVSTGGVVLPLTGLASEASFGTVTPSGGVIFLVNTGLLARRRGKLSNAYEGPYYLAAAGSTAAVAGAAQLIHRAPLAIALQFVVEQAAGGSPTVTFKFQGSIDGTNWYDVGYITDASDSISAAPLTMTAVGSKVLFLSNPAARRFKYFRVNVTANTGCTYRAELYAID